MSDVLLSPLGKTSDYITNYSPELLFPISRQPKRQEIGINADLPFFGVDIWNGYELSWLNSKGKPQVAIASFHIPANSPNIIESKSFKLYLNSFNQTKIETFEQLQHILETDISNGAGAPVRVKLTPPSLFNQFKFGELDGYNIDNLDIEVDRYAPHEGILRCDPSDSTQSEILTSNLLKSNCLVTGQPDWASVQIQYTGSAINRESLLRYLISFRNHNEFHEQCVERIFVDIMRDCAPLKLAVYARYTRRGGLDINPFRANFNAEQPSNLRGARQ
ncbi:MULTISPECIES: NADPH-dependent 7-cyano-7-deazaguanine reductase QueF [Deefgea]|uniref:NADPH-dependent 7-cyano-7-deazaguanine reductase n=1 Tax=Deefgea chitinilytica TaxID=570276 RepID=A0ABS2C981_9NEIS|nr:MULTISPECIES: NADPH-dependent 7-cyano-7-deazaguanine reductase QueF [Deefgea]MBM5570714.1 NADPH-dependent 7-cyano-7-deazaguanine reductase QueF [Deefgea chitinilytica]MBM9887943.1 NADPH-dependent 7-cyano-7-deazaguanine reductase QueF [Deefgea sp. CFH1-16]